jgi:hypothetical protein
MLTVNMKYNFSVKQMLSTKKVSHNTFQNFQLKIKQALNIYNQPSGALVINE